MDAVLWAVTKLLADPALGEAAAQIRLQREGDQEAQKREHLQAMISRLEREIVYNLEAARQGAIDISVLVKQNQPLQDRKNRLERQLQELDRKSGEQETRYKMTATSVTHIRDNGTVEEQRGFLSRVYDRIELRRDHLLFYLAEPTLPVLRVAYPRRNYLGGDLAISWNGIELEEAQVDLAAV